MNKSPKISKIFDCKSCDYKCCKLSEWTKHTLTRKHQNRTNLEQNISNISKYCCKKCNKEYSARNSLWYHQRTCSISDNKVSVIEPQYVDIIQKLNNDNKELRNFIVDQSRTIEKIMIQNNETMSKAIECCKPNNTTINNNNNQKFNINVFLNDQCKDAINFSDFIKNIEISRQDLENNAQLGFVSGISKIFLDNLKQLGVNERPFHCTDTKRETMYIKDEDKWHKEVDDSKLQKAIQTVSYRSMGKLQEWKKENPEEYQDVNSEFSEKCLSIHKHTIAGSNREVYYPKVIHVLARETMVDK